MITTPFLPALAQRRFIPDPLAKLSREELLETLEMSNELSRRNLLDFIRATKPDYKIGFFNRVLCRKIDAFLQAVIQQQSPRLIIMAPPRHGKSEAASRRFPAYALGRYPELSIIATSYSSDLASSMNRDVQRIIDSQEYHNLFPDSMLWGSNIRTVADGSYLRNSDIFEIVNHTGVYKSAGVGAGISGRGGQIMLIDDPVKDAAEAHSKVVRDGIWEWYTTTFYPRQEPGAGIILIMTRWHEDDLAGRLIESMKNGGEKFDVLRFPAVAEEEEFDDDGTLLRHAGDPLFAKRYDLGALERIKIGTTDAAGVGSKTWASLYQQRPAAAEGNVFKRENWRFIRPPQPISSMSAKERREYFAALGIRFVLQAWDTALGGKKKDDNTACTTLGIGKSRYYVINVWKGKVQFPEALKQVELMFDKWAPHKVVVEGGGSASGKATVQTLNRETRIPFKEVSTSTDKELRADTVSPSHEAGLIYIFEGEDWQADFIDQCANFPSIKNDDDVDSFILAMESALQKGSHNWNITQDLLDRIG